MLNLEQIPNEFRQRATEINEVHERLRDRCKSVVTAHTAPVTPKVVWKIDTFQQGVVYRTVALLDGATSCWNVGNGLGAVILARSVMETAAFVWDFTNKLSAAVKELSFGNIDGLVHATTFSTRWEGWEDHMPAAPNILTLLDKLDRHLFGDAGGTHARDVYNFLSEFAHPNFPGTVLFFGELHEDRFEMRFSLTRAAEDRVLDQVILGLGSIEVIEVSLDAITEVRPAIWEIAESTA